MYDQIFLPSHHKIINQPSKYIYFYQLSIIYRFMLLSYNVFIDSMRLPLYLLFLLIMIPSVVFGSCADCCVHGLCASAFRGESVSKKYYEHQTAMYIVYYK